MDATKVRAVGEDSMEASPWSRAQQMAKQWPQICARAYTERHTRGMRHVACGNVICLGLKLYFFSASCVACLACCERIMRQHVQHISSRPNEAV